MPSTVILGTARTPFGKMGGDALLARRHRPRRPRDRGRPGALRRRPRAGPAGRLRPGPAGRPGPDPLAPGPDQGRHPQGGPLGDDQQGLRLGHALARPRRPGDPRRRHRGRRHRRHGVDEPGPVPAARRPLRLPHGRRRGDRRDDPRRPHQPLHRKADDQRGERGLQRAGDHPRRHGPLRRALAPARRRGDRRRPPRRRDRPASRSSRRKGEHTIEADEAIRPETTVETLAGLRAIGGEDATHTAGNAPGVNDGAGAIVVASEEWAEKEGRTPLARVLSYGTVADDFAYLAKTPANAAKQALEKIGKSPEDVDLWEINEAFASVAINSMRMLDVDEDKVNVNGGAIALGHPIGASGARIVGSLVHELRPPRRRPRRRRDLLRRRPGRRDRDRGRRPASADEPRARRFLRPRQDPDGGVVAGCSSPASRPGTGWSAAASWPAGASSTCATACAAPPTSAPARCCGPPAS